MHQVTAVVLTNTRPIQDQASQNSRIDRGGTSMALYLLEELLISAEGESLSFKMWLLVSYSCYSGWPQTFVHMGNTNRIQGLLIIKMKREG